MGIIGVYEIFLVYDYLQQISSYNALNLKTLTLGGPLMKLMKPEICDLQLSAPSSRTCT